MRASIVLVALALAAHGGFSADDLQAGFLNPPQEAKPQTWYHLMNGNVTKAGITRDFEALAEAGFGGVQMFDAGCNIPPGGVDFASDAWFDMMRHAAVEARRLGLEITVPNCSGWSSSGGPWNPPSNAMKRVVFSETRLKGPRRFSGKLPRTADDHGFYDDIAVLAFPTPPAERVVFPDVRSIVEPKSFVLSSDRPFTVRGFTFELDIPKTWCGDIELRIEASDDGTAFRRLKGASYPIARSNGRDLAPRFHGFDEPVTARAIRVTVANDIGATFRSARPEARRTLSNLGSKTFGARIEVPADEFVAPPDQVVGKDAVRDVSSDLSADGTFAWDVPEGEWTVLRVGFAGSGYVNHPASAHGVGLEVDKLSSAAMDYHFEQYAGRLCRALGPLAGKVTTGFNGVLVDSFEVGSQNWTQGFERLFRKRCGYSLFPYLPVFAGHLVGGAEESERFLEDFRRVVADLFAENYAGALAAKCREYGLKLSLEPYGNCPADNLQYGRRADIPMGEFWSHASNPYLSGDGNARFASFIAHVWGKAICATESFTAGPGIGSGRWLTTPFGIKAQGDEAFADGVNRLIYHRFTHQPWADDKYLPGMTMGRWGMHLDRTQTWWPYAKPFFRYQARCQYLLQRGVFVADVLYFVGEDAPNQGGNTDGGGATTAFVFDLPKRYAGDACEKEAMYALKVENGEIVAPGGVRYRLLVVPPVEAMSVRMAETILRLRRAGANIAWKRGPRRAFGLADGPEGDAAVRRLASEAFAAGVMKLSTTEALAKLGVAGQVEPVGRQLPKGVGKINWIHRRDGEVEWYFVALPNREPVEQEIFFRTVGFEPELWDAESGSCVPAANWRIEGGRTVVRVPFNVCGSKFVVFRKKSGERGRKGKGRGEIGRDGKTIDLTGPWVVSFPHEFLPNAMARGAEEKVIFDKLVSWSERPEDGVKYFSGTAVYEKRVEKVEGAEKVILDLGEVREVCEVTVNGKTFEPLWRPPYRLDITSALAPSQPLVLSIRVANLWANRLIGDDRQFKSDCEWTANAQGEEGIKEIPQWVKEGKPSPTGRHTFTTWRHWRASDDLLPSGLLGPVRLLVL